MNEGVHQCLKLGRSQPQWERKGGGKDGQKIMGSRSQDRLFPVGELGGREGLVNAVTSRDSGEWARGMGGRFHSPGLIKNLRKLG